MKIRKIIKPIFLYILKIFNSFFYSIKVATCVYLIKDGYVQMGYQNSKVVGFKGYGGKVEFGQTILQNATEETWQETGGDPKLRINPEEEGGIYIREEWLERVGIIKFYNNYNSKKLFKKPSFIVHFFICRKSMGKAVDTIEMKDHQIFNINYLPIGKMVKGDEKFIPRMLQGTCLTGSVMRDKDWNIIKSSPKECTKESLSF